MSKDAAGQGATAGGVEERVALGRAARQRAPLEDHARFERSDAVDPVAILESQEASRIPELVLIRHAKMLRSPFSFYRGSAAIMAADLATTARSGLPAQVCGDAHLSNFGLFLAADRRILFDVNDFDETTTGPWEWDVKRLVTSIVVAGRDIGLKDKEVTRSAIQAGNAYRETMRDFAGRSNLAVWYARADEADWLAHSGSPLTSGRRSRTAGAVAKAATRDSLQTSKKLTHLVGGQRRLISDPPLLVPVEELTHGLAEQEILTGLTEMLDGYSRSLQPDRRTLLDQFRVVHLARKVVGVGSVGTRAFVVLLVGRDDDDLLLLQAKEAQASVLAPYVPRLRYANQGDRVVRGQHLMQSTSDIFLGARRVVGPDGTQRDFYVRQLRDHKGSAVIEKMTPAGLTAYGRLCAWTLARAHARSGDRVAIAAYLGSSKKFERAVAEFALGYADQTVADHRALAAAVATGRLEAAEA